MVFSAPRVLVFLICIGFLAVEPDKVSGLRSIDLVLRQSQEDHMLAPKNQRILKAVVVEDLNREEKAAPDHLNQCTRWIWMQIDAEYL